MKIFIGQAVTGEDMNNLREEMKKIYASLKDHEYYCTLQEDEKEFIKKTKKEWLNHAFEEIDKADAFLAIVRSEKRSEGMLIEWGYVMANGKKIILAIQKDIKKTELRDLADQVIEFENVDDLVNKLGNII